MLNSSSAIFGQKDHKMFFSVNFAASYGWKNATWFGEKVAHIFAAEVEGCGL